MTGLRLRSRGELPGALRSVLGLIISAGIVFPLIWLFFTAFKSKGEIFQFPTRLLPLDWTFENYVELFRITQFLRYFINTAAISIIAAVISIIIATCASYSLSRFRIPGAGVVAVALLLMYMLPEIVLGIPFMKIFLALGLSDSLVALTIAYISITLPFSIWMLRSYIESIPTALEEAALIDGCTRFQGFVRVIVPQAIPGIMATTIFTFILCWNEYLYALILITSEQNKTLTLGLSILLGETAIYSWGMLSAGSVLTVIPVIILFVFFQKHIVAGFTAGAIKG
jgi:ABC-type glycerol-3-phosphate transport system permease component